jgi:hypothetical protein
LIIFLANVPFLLANSNSINSILQPISEAMDCQGQQCGPSRIRVYFAVKANLIRPWEKMFICGNAQKLGKWEPEKAIEMDKEEAGTINSGFEFLYIKEQIKFLGQIRPPPQFGVPQLNWIMRNVVKCSNSAISLDIVSNWIHWIQKVPNIW